MKKSNLAPQPNLQKRKTNTFKFQFTEQSRYTTFGYSFSEKNPHLSTTNVGSQCVKKVQILKSMSFRGPFGPWEFIMKHSKFQGEQTNIAAFQRRIATPVCGPVRNDSFFAGCAVWCTVPGLVFVRLHGQDSGIMPRFTPK